MSLDMFGTIDDVFASATVTRISYTAGSYVNGIYQLGTETRTTHVANIQPLNDKEVNTLELGNERIIDKRKLFINDGSATNISPRDEWIIEGINGTFKTKAFDDRTSFGRNYCKILITLEDS